MKSSNKIKIKGRNIMVTGGCGFIGSHLVERLLKLGVKKITIIDSMKYGDKARIGNLSGRVKIIKHQIGGRKDETVFTKAMKDIDYLFHLAAEKHNQSKNNPLDVLQSNIIGTFNLLQAASENKIKKILFTSSIYAGGFTNPVPFKEDQLPRPANVYGISKLTGEHLLNYFYNNRGLKSVGLRYFFVYGPKQFAGMGYKSVIVKSFERILKNENPVIFGDGKQALDYFYIDDAIDAAILAMESNYNSGEIFNVGSGIPTSINYLIDTMLKISDLPVNRHGKNLKKTYGPKDETHNTFRVADLSKIKKTLGWRPKTSLEKGLEQTYNWLKESNKST